MLILESALNYANSVFKQQDSNDFGNARGVRNYFDKSIISQANRVVRIKDVSNFEMQTILKEDLLLIEMPKKENVMSKKIGF